MGTRSILAMSVVASISAVNADAAIWNAQLTGVRAYSNGDQDGYPLNIGASTATFVYDDTTQLLSQTGGVASIQLRPSMGPWTYFTHSITGLIMGNGTPASAASFNCIEGNFGPTFGISACGNYAFGGNFLNESTVSWGPGTAVSRTMGGDDTVAGPPRSLALYDAMSTVFWDGSTLMLSNATCDSNGDCFVPILPENGERFRWTLQTTPVPIPPAVWLFGSALGALVWTRRTLPT